jgi:UDP-N-acetylglucosamine 4,6-dehydratase
MDWTSKRLLITGGTGSFGKAFVDYALKHLHPKTICIYSRDELKQAEMREAFNHPSLRFFVGDVRDSERLGMAFKQVDLVIHAAAMKRVEACEYNPFEAIQTNVIGTQNVVTQAIKHGVQKVLAISSDKAVNPINLYGATKLCQEKIMIQGNSYVGSSPTRFACVRYGNVVGSRGSIVPLFISCAQKGEAIPITDERMTRFWITLAQAVSFVESSMRQMVGGEIFVPKLPSMKVTDLADAVGPQSLQVIVGIRPGEKLHEVMLTEDDSRFTLDLGDRYLVKPQFPWWKQSKLAGTPVPEGFRYSSDNNAEWLTASQLKQFIL